MNNSTIIEKYLPVTRTGHIVKAELPKVLEVLKAHAQWGVEGFGAKRVSVTVVENVARGLDAALQFLDPLVDGDYPTRILVLSTLSCGWVRVVSNNLRFAGLPGLGALLSNRLKTDSVFFMLQPHTRLRSPSKSTGEFGAIQLAYFHRGKKQRVVELVYDSGWKFGASGKPFPFEQVDRYKSRLKPERFTPEMLIDMLAHLGLQPFDDDFYQIDAKHLARGVALDVHDRKLLKDEFKPVSFEEFLKR